MPSSGQMCWQYLTVYGCVGALATAVVAVTVAVRDSSGPSASKAASRGASFGAGVVYAPRGAPSHARVAA